MANHSYTDQYSLFQIDTAEAKGPECLGLTFSDDNARREYFLGILREKLQDPNFRSIEGFPVGSDEDILALSDPPYYTACPNPFIADFIKHYGKPYNPETDDYHREPFASDTCVGKRHPIYFAHPYHSKIPHLAIMPYILHYTNPGDIVLDGFSGSGMTGLAAQLCGQPETQFRVTLEAQWKKAGYPPPKWGPRRAILIDLSPVANFISYNLNVDISAREFKKAADGFLKKIEAELGWMYETLHTDGNRKGHINYVVWSEVFICPNCAGDVVFVDQAYDTKTGKLAAEFQCPNCHTTLTARSCKHKFMSYFDEAIGETVRKITYVPVEIVYTLPGDKTKYRKKPDAYDLALIHRLANEKPKDWFPTAKLPIGKMEEGDRLAKRGITHYHQFYLQRALHALSTMWRIAGEWPDARVRGFLKFMVEQCFWGMTMMNCYRENSYSQVGNFLPNLFYLPMMMSEISPWVNMKGKYKLLYKMLITQQLPISRHVVISTASSLQLPLPDKSVDYIYTDPPFGGAVHYGDLNLLIEAWHNLFSHLEHEVLWDEPKNKTLSVYSDLIRRAFAEYYRVLKPGRWMTVVFHNSQNLVWRGFQEAIGAAGFVVAGVRILDSGPGSFNQVTAAGAVQQYLLISAYKPNDGQKYYFKLEAGKEEGAWNFVRTRLKQLPVFVSKYGQTEVMTERKNYLLFNRMVAFHVLHCITVPMSAKKFYAGLAQRFPERDGMFFLPEQVVEYDKMKRTTSQMEVIQRVIIY